MSTTIVKRPSIPSVSIETLRVVKLLRETPVGQSVPWDNLETLTGCPRSRVYNMVRTACKTLESEMLHYRVIPGEGVERISHNVVAAEVLPAHRKRIAGAARKMVRKTRAISLEGLKDNEKSAVILTQTIGELVSHACSSSSVKLISAESPTAAPYTAKEAMKRLLQG